ncbi:hypothetical protein ACJX0J_009218, partial [Zea mays]
AYANNIRIIFVQHEKLNFGDMVYRACFYYMNPNGVHQIHHKSDVWKIGVLLISIWHKRSAFNEWGTFILFETSMGVMEDTKMLKLALNIVAQLKTQKWLVWDIRLCHYPEACAFTKK